ncbi:Hsp70 family protein [Radicibacter daui]|uniref:Hsp70 family protein n=1 Tax=Radicibacter daui TaxID=3064829 RepID=UPI004046F804
MVSPKAAGALSVGIDFGTANTVIALADAAGDVRVLPFEHNEIVSETFPTALCFWEEVAGGEHFKHVEAGPWAISQYLNGLSAHRFIQSFKSFAASGSFKETRIFSDRFRFEDLLAAFMRVLQRHAEGTATLAGAPVRIGRPVRFAGASPDEALAMERYRAGFASAGITDARYVYEPVAAAFFFARQLAADATILVADFGGGTSDFSVIRFTRRNGRLEATPLGNAGIGIAGDSFDARLIDKVVAPELGKGSEYRSMGAVLPLPNRYFAGLASWNQLAVMKHGRDLADLVKLARMAIDPEPLQAFIRIVEDDLGFALHRAVSATKIALSDADSAPFSFTVGDVEIERRISRADFESWIAPDVTRLGETVDQALANAGIGEAGIDAVFFTGGSSSIPAIRQVFADRFGTQRLTFAERFSSIAAGLALMAQADDLDGSLSLS